MRRAVPAILSVAFISFVSVSATAKDWPKAGILEVTVKVTGHYDDPRKVPQGKYQPTWRDHDYNREAHVEIPLTGIEYDGMLNEDVKAQNEAADAMMKQSGLSKADMSNIGNAVMVCAKKFESCGDKPECEQQMQDCATSAALANNGRNYKQPAIAVKPELTRFVQLNTPVTADVQNQHGCVKAGHIQVRDRFNGRELDSVKGWYDIRGEVTADVDLPIQKKTYENNDFCGTKVTINTKKETYDIHIRFLSEVNTTLKMSGLSGPSARDNGRIKILASNDKSDLDFSNKPISASGSISGQETIRSGANTILVSWSFKPTSVIEK
ncbi:hypothetical protein AA309_00875 [Microvirga vignae]|uniref:Uncharacterized protein n=1 Tax=Microvirga vignae TaxID=1225564 RepID=A0A0H1RQ64_9HYPH|nr:hypothetical protein [Microvirga vignae]KLK94792.1 hypothetical protein AA309_00875 [Microvirga vignae]